MATELMRFALEKTMKTTFIKDKELTIKEGIVHVEFPRGLMETFVWLPNHGDLGYYPEFMDQFFDSMDEHAIKVPFDLHDDMIVHFVENYTHLQDGKPTVGMEYQHLFIAMTKKLEQCLATLKAVSFEGQP